MITGCNGTIDLSAMDILAENLLYESSPPAVLENNTGATEHSAIKVAAYGSQQIDGSSTQSLTASYARLTVVCDGSAWQVI